jgi:hypothetical protein
MAAAGRAGCARREEHHGGDGICGGEEISAVHSRQSKGEQSKREQSKPRGCCRRA